MSSFFAAVLMGCLAFPTPILQSPPPLHPPKVADPRVVASGNASIADFDLDGVPDVALTNNFLQAVSGPFVVLRMDESGQAVGRDVGPMTINVFALYKSSAVADVDRDGLPDLLTTNSQGQLEVFANGGPSRLRAAGQRFFDPVVLDDLSVNILGTKSFFFPVMFCADLDADGEQDLVMAGHIQRLFLPTMSSGLNVYFGDGVGLFPSRSWADAGLTMCGRAADFDRDGRLEIVLLTEAGRIHPFSTLGRQLTAWTPYVLPFPWKTTSMDVGDLDRDGVPDYVFAGDPGQAKLCVITGTSTAGLGRMIPLDVPPGPASDEITAVRLFDLDYDSKLDVVSTQSFGAADKARLLWHRGGGDGSFEPAGYITLPGKLGHLNGMAVPEALSATDLNRDANPELVLTTLLPAEGSPAQTAMFPNWYRSRCLVEHFGTGATGSGDFRPRIGAAGGAPLTGRKDFGITLTDAVGGGATAALLCGVKPIEASVAGELTFYTVPRFVSVHSTRGHGAGGGFVVVPCPVPEDPAVVGLQFLFQWIVADIGPGRTIPATTSDALRVVVGLRNP